MGKYLLTAYLAALSFAAFAFQSKTLFSIGKESTSAEEFKYFYTKNSQNNSDAFTKKDVQEYLDLFINFKLKVAYAKKMGYDTTASFKNELNVYLKQLSESFLNSNRLKEQLVKEAYQRKKYDVDASHILITIPNEGSPEDTLKAFEKAMGIYKMASEGQDFSALASQYSEEPGAATTKGRLGFFTVFQMVYPFESAVYGLKENEISKPVRTQFGYHIIKLNKKRPAMGVVEVAHIMIRFAPGMSIEDSAKVHNKIEEAFQLLSSGAPWDSVCTAYSEDLASRQNKGAIRPFGVRGLNVPEFENVAYDTNQGEFSKPFETSFGWHILRVNKKTTVSSFDEEHDAIVRRIESDSRSKLPREQWINNLKRKNEFNETQPIDASIKFLYDSTYKASPDKIVFTIGTDNYSQSDIEKHFEGINIKSQADAFRHYHQYVEDLLIEKEESVLIQENTEYRMLREEYYEGILLFSIMEDEVWKKAELDSVGLRNYFEENRGQFRISGMSGTLLEIEPSSQTQAVYEELLENFENLAIGAGYNKVKMWVETTLNSQSGLNLRFKERVYPNGDPFLKKLVAGVNLIDQNDKLAILILDDKSSEHIANFDEVRGNVISSYQEQLEDKWLKELHGMYKIKVSKKVFNEILDEFESR